MLTELDLEGEKRKGERVSFVNAVGGRGALAGETIRTIVSRDNLEAALPSFELELELVA